MHQAAKVSPCQFTRLRRPKRNGWKRGSFTGMRCAGRSIGHGSGLPSDVSFRPRAYHPGVILYAAMSDILKPLEIERHQRLQAFSVGRRETGARGQAMLLVSSVKKLTT